MYVDSPYLFFMLPHIGHHVDKHESYETDSHGHRKLVSRDVYVEDFRMMYDLTPYISPRGIIYTAPDPKTGHIPTLREAMEQYAEEENPFKEIRMHKVRHETRAEMSVYNFTLAAWG